MHELSVCLALIREIEHIAREHDASSVTSIVVRIGPLAGVEPALLRRAYPLAASGTVAESAELILETPEVVVHCTQCGQRSAVPANRLLCASCGDFRTRLESGDEMVLQSVELDCDARRIRPAGSAQ